MKKYVVAIISLFENDLKQFKVEAENEYEAVKKGFLLYSDNNEHEIEWQKQPDYPKDIQGLYFAYEEMPFSVTEI